MFCILGNGSRLDVFNIRTDKHVRSYKVTDSEDIYKIIEGQGMFRQLSDSLD